MDAVLKLFSKSYRKDFPWLKMGIQSVLKLWKRPIDHMDWHIVVEQGEKSEANDVINQAIDASKSGVCHFQISEVQEHFDDATAIQSGYLRQQWVKMNAHRVMGDGLFWNWDSDVIAVRPFDSSIFMSKNGRPIHWISQMNHIMVNDPGGKAAHEGRIHLTQIIMDYKPIIFEYMRCMPSPMIGQILEHGANSEFWRRAYAILVSGDHRFSEFNVIGIFAHHFFPDAFDWRNAEQMGPTHAGGYTIEKGKCVFQAHAYVSQSWSWGGISKEVEEYVNAL